VGARLGVPIMELDALNWGPNWLNRSRDDIPEFSRRAREAVVGDSWVTDGNYKVIRPIIMDRATHLIWLDYGRFTIMTRVIRRSFSRAIRNSELWPGTGNREDFRRWLDPEHPIRWAWDTMAGLRVRYAEQFASNDWPDIERIRCRHPSEAEAWLNSLPAPQSK
jgi:adenylate kinase family enzyme